MVKIMKNFNKYKKNYKKNILNYKFNKLIQSHGSIAVVVLIIGIVVLLAVSTLSSFMIRDVKFTKLDQQKLQALNIAEAGISNMYLNIIKYLKDGTPLPVDDKYYPDKSYDGSVISDGIEVGSYHVNYTITEPESNLMTTYTIISTGKEKKSGQQRTIKVTIVIPSLYDFIFSNNSLTNQLKITGNTTIEGPFMINGDLEMSGNGNIIDGNPIIINGKLTIGGTGGSGTVIGSDQNLVDMYLGGTCNIDLTEENNIYLDNLYNQVVDLPLVRVDDEYIERIKNTGAAVYDESIVINGNDQTISPPPKYSNPTNYIEFDNEGILNIVGNITVNGNITIENGKNDIIYYSGEGNLISTDSINLESKLVPQFLSTLNFPEDKLVGLISIKEINFNLPGNTKGTIDKPDAAVNAICDGINGIIKIEDNKYIRGNLVGGQLDIGKNTVIHFEPVSSNSSEDFPLSGYFVLTQNWQEIPNS